jgi:threonine dehydrogenase-like Zn-dependent dehydrogenase
VFGPFTRRRCGNIWRWNAWAFFGPDGENYGSRQNIILVGKKGDQEVRFKVAEKFGATHLIFSDAEDAVTRVNQIAGKNGIGLVVDCAGTPIVIKQALQILKSNGQIVQFGVGHTLLDFPILDFAERSITLTGV